MPVASTPNTSPIAVFDSGIGGLTVVSALVRELPDEDIVYLGDTARVPYGGKSRATIERYSEEIASMLVREGAKMVVVACNTASALGLRRLRETLTVPVEGVIEPGVSAALSVTRTGHVAVLGTKATIASGAYAGALREARPDIQVTSVPCPLLVPLVEEGMFDDEVTDAVLKRYLSDIRSGNADTLVMGCTHYPLLARAISRAAGPEITLVDSAANCAREVARHLEALGLRAPAGRSGTLDISFTDTPDKFLEVVRGALGLEAGTVRVRQVPPLA